MRLERITTLCFLLFGLISLFPCWAIGESRDGVKRETVGKIHDDTQIETLIPQNEIQFYNSTCHRNNTCIAPNDTRKCNCDAECLIYGDCCYDHIISQKERMSQNGVNHLSRCKLLQKNRINDVPITEVWANMISLCPKNFKGNGKILNNCEARFNFSDDWNYSRDIPVYGRDLLFKNIFCASCHGLSPREIQPWTITLKCSKDFENGTFQEFINGNGTIYKHVDRSFSSNGQQCFIQITELTNLKENKYKIHLCEKDLQDQCDKNFNETSTINLCHSYANYLMSDETIYKNPHCALCSKVGEDEIRNFDCKISTSSGPGIFRILQPPLSLLFDFDFRLDFELQVGFVNVCSDEETWNGLQNRCDPKHCAKNEVLKAGKCVSAKQQDQGDDKKALITLMPVDESPIGSEGIEQGCPRIFLHKDEYEMDENLTVRVNRTDRPDKSYHVGKYEMWNDTTISICGGDDDENDMGGFQLKFSTALSYVSSISLIISLVCLLLHLILYLLLPKLRNLPGRNLTCLALSLFIAQLLFLTLANGSRIKELCITSAISMHYFFLAAFFWMNIMSFDIWRTFTCKMMRRRGGSGRNITFIKYSFFAWLLPALIVSLAVGLDFSDFSPAGSTEQTDETIETQESAREFDLSLLEKLKPSYGQNGICWISKRMSLFTFFAIPVFCVVSGNLILFALTARAIFQQQREATKVLNQKDSPSKMSSTLSQTSIKDEIRLKLYVKLGLIMGLTWVLGFVAAALDSQVIWYPFVVFNGLQGAFIFMAFDCKGKIAKMLKEKFELSHSASHPSRRGTTTSFTSKSTTISTSLRTNPDPV